MWDLIVSVPDHCLSFYFQSSYLTKKCIHVCISNMNDTVLIVCE